MNNIILANHHNLRFVIVDDDELILGTLVDELEMHFPMSQIIQCSRFDPSHNAALSTLFTPDASSKTIWCLDFNFPQSVDDSDLNSQPSEFGGQQAARRIWQRLGLDAAIICFTGEPDKAKNGLASAFRMATQYLFEHNPPLALSRRHGLIPYRIIEKSAGLSDWMAAVNQVVSHRNMSFMSRRPTGSSAVPDAKELKL